MPVTNIPCGCTLAWGEDNEADLAFCEEHDVEYEKWRWTDLDFIRMVATPRYARIKQSSLYRGIIYFNS